MRPLLFACCLFFSVLVHAQDYISYQQCFIRMDDDIGRMDYSGAIARLDSIDQQYDFVYARHCIKAVQLCVLQGDSIRGAHWLSRAFRQGIPLWVLRRQELTAPALSYACAAPVIARYDSLRAAYHAGINKDVAQRIDRLLLRDQARTAKVNAAHTLTGRAWHGLRWLHQNRRQFRQINRIARHYGLPGERLIGLSPWYQDSTHFPAVCTFDKRDFSDERAYVMLIHYYSYRHRDMDSTLQQAVQSGNLYGWQYGTLNDYLVTYGRKAAQHYQPYFVWKNLKELKEAPALVDQRRWQKGINSIGQQQHNTQALKDPEQMKRRRGLMLE